MFDEMLLENGEVRAHYAGFERWKARREAGFSDGEMAWLEGQV